MGLNATIAVVRGTEGDMTHRIGGVTMTVDVKIGVYGFKP